MADNIVDIGLDQDKQEAQAPKQPIQASLSGNPLVDFFNSMGGGLVRGAQGAAGDIGESLATATGNQGLQDWANKTTQDVSLSTPDYAGHNVLGTINAVTENLGGALAPVAAGFVGAAAAPEEIAGGVSLAAGAAAMAPIGFGNAKMEAIQRGADDATANRIGFESGAAQAALFTLPLHQILSSGGPILERVLTNAAVNAGAGAALSYGQEEIMKANDVRPLPDGGEFNNTVYSTLIGGLTGMIFGAFAPDEMMPRVNAIVDNHMAPQMQAQLEAQYVAQGMDPKQAAIKALDMVTDKRPQMIQETQDMYNRARFSVSNLLKGNYDIVNSGKVPEPLKVYSRDPAGNRSEYELTYMNSSKETNEEASKIAQAGFSTVKVDKDGDAVVDPVTRFPIIEKSLFPEMPKAAQIIIHDVIVKQLEAGKTRDEIFKMIQTRSLPVLDRNAVIYTGAAHGEPSETQNSLYHYNMGVGKIHEVAKNALDSNGLIHPEIMTVYDMGDEEGTNQAWKLLHQSFTDQKEKQEEMNRKFPQTPAPEPSLSQHEQMVEDLKKQITDLQAQLLAHQQGESSVASLEAQKDQHDQEQLTQQVQQEHIQDTIDKLARHIVEDQKQKEQDQMQQKTDDESQNIVDSMKPVTDEVASTSEEKKIDNTWNQTIDPENKVNMNDKEKVKKAIEEKTAGMAEKDVDSLVDKLIEMQKQKPPALAAHAETQLGPQLTGRPITPQELDQANPRTLPLKLMLGAASMFGRRQDFLNWARGHYGQEFSQKFLVTPPVDIADEIIQGFKTDKTTKDLIRHIATDNLSNAMKESWRIATGLTGMLHQKGLVKDTKPKTIQDVNRKFGELMSLASEERRANGEKTFLGTQQQIAPSGQPGTKDEWRVRDTFHAKYMEHLATWGMPPPDPQSFGVRPELAFTNILHDLAGDHAEKLLMWTKNEMEEPVFQQMVKAGVFSQAGIMANVAFGYAPRIHDLKGAQKEYQQGRGTVGDPTKSSGVLQRDAWDYSDFLARSKEQGLDTVPHYLDAMSEYVQQSLPKAMQYNTLNWLRMFRIPNSDKLGIPGHETAETRAVIKNLNYVEYASSHNIQKLSELTGLKPNAVLEHLGYFNKKDAEGLVGWDKFHFEKPFMQGALSDVLDFYYPKTALQSEFVSNVTGVLNFPKWMMVAFDPLQHVALFSTAVLGNSGWRLPIVMGRWALHSYKALANMPFAALATLKGEPQTRMALLAGGGPIEPGYENQENLAKFLTYGHGATLGALPEGIFQDQKIQKYLIPEMMSGRQGWDAAMQSTLSATKIMFGHFLQREIYNVTNERYNQFRNQVGPNGEKLMTDQEAARRAVNLINSTSGVVHASDFGPYGPAWSLLTFARGLTIAPLRVISGTIEPTLRKIYGNTNKFKIDPVSGVLNPINMGDLSPRDADFLQAYYAQHLAKIIAMRVLAAGVVQYAMSFGDDDKKDEFGQEGHDLGNKKRFIFNNPAGMRMAIRTPWTDVNGRRIMMNPTPFREASQLVDMTGLGSKYKFPESTMNWIKNRLNVWEGLMLGAAYGVDIGTGQEIPGKGTDEYGDELTKWMMAKVMPLSLGFTQEEKEQRTEKPADQFANRLGAFFGTTPTVAPKNWYPGYEDAQNIEKEFQEKRLEAREDTATMTKEEVARKQLTKFFTRKEQQNIEQGKEYNYNKVRSMMNAARKEAESLQPPEPIEQQQP